MNGYEKWIKVIPLVVAVFSGSAGGAITASALQIEPLSVNEIVKTETKVLAAIQSHGAELERIYGALGALDDRQRAMHTQITRLEVQFDTLQDEHNASR